MKRVTGMGGMFFYARNPKTLAEWYDKHLGLSFGSNTYQVFNWDDDPKPDGGATVFSFFKETSNYFAPSEKTFMLNLRVENLDWLLETLKSEGVELVGEPQAMEGIGKFAWIMDPEGNKVELWQPPVES